MIRIKLLLVAAAPLLVGACASTTTPSTATGTPATPYVTTFPPISISPVATSVPTALANTIPTEQPTPVPTAIPTAAPTPVPSPAPTVYADACRALTAASNNDWLHATQYWGDLELQQESVGYGTMAGAIAVDELYQVAADSDIIAGASIDGTSTTADIAAYTVAVQAVTQFTAGC